MVVTALPPATRPATAHRATWAAGHRNFAGIGMFGLYVDRFRRRISCCYRTTTTRNSTPDARGLVVWGREIWLPHASLIADELTGKGSRVTY